MNRRDLLKRTFQIGAAGLMLPVLEPVRKVWALDRTMVPNRILVDRFRNFPIIGDMPDNIVETGWFDTRSYSFAKIPKYDCDIMRVTYLGNDKWHVEETGTSVINGVIVATT